MLSTVTRGRTPEKTKKNAGDGWKGLDRIGNKYAESEAEAIEIIANLWND